MIAVDTSSLRRYLEGASGRDVEAVDRAIESRQLLIPPVVVTEIVSDPRLSEAIVAVIADSPLVVLEEGFWARAGRLRAALLSDGYKAFVADCLIAQSCIDARLVLITNDRDFRHFINFGLAIY